MVIHSSIHSMDLSSQVFIQYIIELFEFNQIEMHITKHRVGRNQSYYVNIIIAFKHQMVFQDVSKMWHVQPLSGFERMKTTKEKISDHGRGSNDSIKGNNFGHQSCRGSRC